MSTQLLRNPQRWFALPILLVCCAASDVQAVTNFVTNLGDSGPGSLRQAIVDCNNSGGGTVMFSNVNGAIVLVSNLPSISASLRLFGPGTNSLTITSSNQWYLVFGAGTTNDLRGVTIVNGTIRNLGNLRMANCLLTWRQSFGYDPPGIDNAGDIVIMNSVIARRQNLGAGGGALATRGSASVSDSLFDSNVAGDSYSGGVGMGGAILVTGGRLTVTWCVFVGNRAVGRAGPSEQSYPPRPDGPGGDAAGGAMHINNGIVEVRDSSFDGNSVTGGNGGQGLGLGSLAGTAFGGAVSVQTGRVDFINCTFTRNISYGAEGGSSVRGYGTTPPGEAAGGALAMFGGNTSVANSTFASNVVYGGLGGASYGEIGPFPANGGDARGGAIVVKGGSLELKNCTVAGNKAVGKAGGSMFIWWTGQTRYGANGSGYGGGLAVDGNPGTASIVSTIVARNLGVLAETNVPYATDGYGFFSSQGFNLIGTSSNTSGLTASDRFNVDPRLGPLQNNGGPTLTYALLAGSPAIDAGTNAVGAGDQRGQPRTIDDPAVSNAPDSDGTDIGALEVNPVLTGTGVVVAGSNVLVRFTSVSDRSYRLQYKDRLQDAWSAVSGAVPGTGGIATLTNISAGNLPSRFYRVYSTSP